MLSAALWRRSLTQGPTALNRREPGQHDQDLGGAIRRAVGGHNHHALCASSRPVPTRSRQHASARLGVTGAAQGWPVLTLFVRARIVGLACCRPTPDARFTPLSPPPTPHPLPVNTPILSVCLLHPGVIGCGTPSGDIKVVQPQGEMTFAALSGHTAPVTGLTKLTAARVASCSNDGTLRIFLTRVGVCETTIELQPHQAPRCIAGMPSGQIVAGCEDGCVRVYAPGSGARAAAPALVLFLTSRAAPRLVAFLHCRHDVDFAKCRVAAIRPSQRRAFGPSRGTMALC